MPAMSPSMPGRAATRTEQVYAQLRGDILAGRLAPGARLPSVRELMARHKAGPQTVQRAISALAAEGLVEPRPGRGTFVAAPKASVSAPDDAPDLAQSVGTTVAFLAALAITLVFPDTSYWPLLVLGLVDPITRFLRRRTKVYRPSES